MNTVIEHRTTKVVTLQNTVATRSYPFTQRTLDQIKDLRADSEDGIFESTGETVMVPAPVVIAEAINQLHKATFEE
jgi:hypothetical protein